ncbi:MAG TPA: hypothetical protein ENK52_03965 [Saprospiraceae bacterium]|nr:hypothetical protein [Saprospiraceae bacterium]
MDYTTKIIFLFFTLFLIIGCKNIESENHRILIIYDVTGSTQSNLPNADKVLKDIAKIYDLSDKNEMDNYIHDGFEIGFTFLDELSDARTIRKTLKPAKGTTAEVNPKKRKRLIKDYSESIHEMIGKALTGTPADRPMSKIYAKLCKALNKEAGQNADTRHVIIYTDLLENSELAKFYNPKTLQQAAQAPVEFSKKHLESFCQFGDLSAITIHLYPYRTAGTDAFINQAEKFWVTLLENHGATVKVNP